MIACTSPLFTVERQPVEDLAILDTDLQVFDFE